MGASQKYLRFIKKVFCRNKDDGGRYILMKNDFGKRLKELRIERGMTQQELCYRTGLSAAHISQFETGNRKPSMKYIIILADILCVSCDYLLCRSNEFQHEKADTIISLYSRLSSADQDLFESILAILSRKTKLPRNTR